MIDYHIMLSNELSAIVSEVSKVETKDGYVSFKDKQGNVSALYRLDNIIGFCKFQQQVPEAK